MKLARIKFTALLLGLSHMAAAAQTNSLQLPAIAAGPFKPDWNSLTNYQTPDWFRDAKLGFWAHWTPQSAAEDGDWYARNLYIQGSSQYEYHLKHFGHPSQFGFKDICNLWKGEKWEPAKLMDLYQKAGAKYFVALANHHDNFDCWDSKYQPWNSVNVGPKKDIVGIWAAEARQRGLRFGISYHNTPGRAWREFMPVYYGSDTNGPFAGVPHDGRLTKADGKGKWWDGLDPQDLYGPMHGGNDPCPEFTHQFFLRVDDLLEKYHPDITVFDDSLDHIHELGIVRSLAEEAPELAASFYNRNQTWHGGKQEGVFTIKEVPPNLKSAVTESFENSMDDAIMPDPWQVETEIGGWQYQRGHAFRSSDTVIKSLVDVVSRNGNLLVGIVQRPDGSIEPETEKFLAEMAAWTQVNGQAIFGTRPWKIYGEGPSVLMPKKKLPWGPTALYQEQPFTAVDIRFTQSKDGKTIYAIALNVPKNEVEIKSLAGEKIADVKLLGSEEIIQWRSGTNALVIQPVTNWPSKFAVAWQITLATNHSKMMATTKSRSAARLIEVNPAAGGRVFEGIGAVSAGASSRLLIEYPEKQRREVLNYLFKPHYGAGFQHLKVEIGGEVNSTDGIELTHMRSRDDEDYQRGYEWWLMEEAKRRNHDIILDCLAWGAPGWIGDGKYYSQDMADYVVKFLQGAKQVHYLDIAYTGIWNETPHDTNWIKLLRRTLDSSGLKKVGIVAADNFDHNGWKIVDDMIADPELRSAVTRVGVHYRDSKSPAPAQNIGCSLWSSEDGPWRGDWEGATRLARTINRNYVTGKFTKTEIWSPVTSYYDSLPLPGSGVMRANEPWSGHYEVQPAVWAVAHTTQFAPPGWRYLDSACVLIDGGSVVALASPRGKDFSLVIETMDAKLPQTLEFQITGLPEKTLHVWLTSKEQQIEHVANIHPVTGKFSLTGEPNCIYSLTTTSGQRKGTTSPPASATLPLPYTDDFSSYRPGDSPRLFSDQSGVFEIQKRTDGLGNCLREVLRQDGIPWHSHLDPKPETILGDLNWKDYTVVVDAQIPTNGYALLLGRVTIVPQNNKLPSSYAFKVTGTGEWELRAIRTTVGPKLWDFKTTGDTGTPLAQGHADFAANSWHQLELSMMGDEITVRIEGKVLATVHDSTHRRGQAGLGCDWSGADFANVCLKPSQPISKEQH